MALEDMVDESQYAFLAANVPTPFHPQHPQHQQHQQDYQAVEPDPFQQPNDQQSQNQDIQQTCQTQPQSRGSFTKLLEEWEQGMLAANQVAEDATRTLEAKTREVNAILTEVEPLRTAFRHRVGK